MSAGRTRYSQARTIEEQRSLSTAVKAEIEANRMGRLQAERRRRSVGANPVTDRCAGGRVLVDIGCGTGALIRQVHDRYDTVVGIDFIPLKRPEFANALVLRADLRDGIPLTDGVAETLTATELIEHIADPTLLVREAFRIARPGAEFVLTTPNVRYVRHLLRLVVQGRGPKTSGLGDDDLLWDGGHIHYFTSKDVVTLLEDAGFISVRSMALIDPRGFLSPIRRLLSRYPGNPLVREFLTGRLLVVGKKPEEGNGP